MFLHARKFIKAKNGFTLIETIIYVALLSIVIASFISFAMNITAIREKNFIIQEIQANSRTVKHILTNRIMKAVDVLDPPSGTASSTLTLIYQDAGQPIVFFLDNGFLYLEGEHLAPDKLTSNKVYISNLVFTNTSDIGDKDNIRIEMTIKNRLGASHEYKFTQSLNFAASLRRHN